MSELRDLARVLGGALMAWGNEEATAPEPVIDDPGNESDTAPPPAEVSTTETETDPEVETEANTEPDQPTTEPSAVIVFDEKLEDGWFNYSWAPNEEITGDAPSGQRMLSADLDNWRGLNLHNPNGFALQDYDGVQFWVLGGGPGIRFSIYNGETMLGTGELLDPEPRWRLHRYTWADLGAPTHGRFTNLVWEGTGSADRDLLCLDRIALMKRDTPAPMPEAPPMTAAPATDGHLTLEGQTLKDTNGQIFVGKGLNFQDFKGCNSCLGIELQRMLAESKRRMDFTDTLGVDFLRYCLESEESIADAPAAYWDALKDIVSYAWTKSGRKKRVMVSLWREGSLEGKTQGPTMATVRVARMLARAFKDSGHVWIGLGNEPEHDDAASQQRWRDAYRACTEAIREEGFEGIVVVQGLGQWARRVGDWIGHELTDLGPVLYETRGYDHQADWDKYIGAPHAAGLPLLIGEWGPAANTTFKVDFDNRNNLHLDETVHTTGNWWEMNNYWMNPSEIEPFWAYIQNLGITSCAWQLSLRCPPDLLQDNSGGTCGIDTPLALTEWGERFKRLLPTP